MLTETLRSAPATSIDDVLSIMTAIDSQLPDADGLKWFNRLYLQVTREAAWTNAEVLWTLRRMPHLRAAFFDRLDGLTGLAGKGLLVPVSVDPV